MNTTPVDLVLSRIRSHGYPGGKGPMLKSTPRGWEARCPSHDDRMPSLGIAQGDRGDALLKCAAGCTVEQITAALGLTMKDLFMPAGTTAPKTTPAKHKKTHATLAEAVSAAQFGQAQRLEVPKESLTPAGCWEYHDAAGKVVAAVARFNTPTPAGERQKKQFSPLHAVPGGWQVGDPAKWPLYHLPAVLQAIKERARIWWVEGEKAADAATALGLIVTTTAHGAKSVHLTDLSCLTTIEEVILTPDNDESGEKYVRDIAARILAVSPLARVKIVRLPNLPPHGDFVEYIASWGDAPVDAILEELNDLADKAEAMTNTPPPPPAPATQPATITVNPMPDGPMPEGSPLNAAKDGKPWVLRDLGNAWRFVHHHREKCRYDARKGVWRIWDGRHWEADENETGVYSLAAETIKGIWQEAANCPRAATAEEIGKWAAKCMDRHKLENMLVLASKQAAIVPPSTAWDKDPYAFNCANGIINLKTAELGSHDPSRLMTCLSPARYDPKAESELLLHSLADWHHDLETVLFLQMAAGYSLTGDTGEEKLFLIHGPPATGKSTFIEMMKSVLGTYSRTAEFSTFLKRGGNDGGNARPDIARLAGARFVSSVESEEGKEIAEGLVKGMTGGDTITARYLYRSDFEYKPQFKLWLVTNHAPHVDPDDAAMWRRLVRVPFEKEIPPEKRDKSVKDRLINVEESGAAFLAWAVMGCIAWLEGGLRIPMALNTATTSLREEMDSTAEFFEECMDFGPLLTCNFVDIIQKYDGWAQQRCIPQGRRLGSRRLANKVKARGGIPQQNHGQRWWQGVHPK